MIRILEFISSDMKDSTIIGKVIRWGSVTYTQQKDASTLLYLVNTFDKLFKAPSFVSKNDYNSVQLLGKPAQKHKTRVLLVTECPQLDTPLNICTYSKSLSTSKKRLCGYNTKLKTAFYKSECEFILTYTHSIEKFLFTQKMGIFMMAGLYLFISWI